jgi:hypothetical protein
VVLILIGDEGGGKGTLCRLVTETAGAAGLQITGSDALTGMWNDHLVSISHLFVDEAICTTDKQATSKLKSLVTVPTIFVQTRFLNAYQAKIYTMYVT